MDNFPINHNDKSIDVEQVPHSGQLPGKLRENPHREFDKTPLKDAYALTDKNGDYVIVTHDSAAELLETKVEKKSKKSLFIGLGATAAGLLVAGGAFFGISAANDTPKSEPVAEAPVDSSEPVETEAPAETPVGFEVAGLPSVAEIEISAEQTNEEIAEDLVNAFSDWSMVGANREMYDLQFEGDNGYLGLSEYVAKVAEVSDPVYEEALFGEKVSDPLFQEVIDFKELQHNQVLMAHYQTYGTQNEAPYFSIEKFVSLQNVVEGDDGTITMYVDTVREDNGDKNIVDGTGTGNHTRANYVISKVDGVVKIVEPPLYVDQ